jgi:outer membrane protein TolC
LRISFASIGAARAAGLEVESQRIQHERIKQNIIAQVVTARDRVATAVEQIDTAAEGLNSAQAAFDLSRTRFQGGVAIELEVLDSESSLVDARTNLVDAIIGYNVAQVQLLQAIGDANPNALIK